MFDEPLLDQQATARLVLEELERIDPERPLVDPELAAQHLVEYLGALGLPARPVRWLPDLQVMREGRDRNRDRGYWDAYHSRQSWALDLRERRLGARELSPHFGEFPRASLIAGLDRSVLAVGLGRSTYVDSVRWITTDLEQRAWQLLNGEGPKQVRRLPALLPLARVAAAGAFATGVGKTGDLVVVPRPRLRLDAERRLHDWDGRLAAEWPTGRGLYFWRGVHMTERAGARPDGVTPSRIVGWANAERRRVAIERIGIEAFMKGIGAEVVQTDDYGKLWRTELEVDDEPFVAVEVVNATEESDGSRRTYFLRVPPEIRSARRAVAWTFGLTRTEYVPAVES